MRVYEVLQVKVDKWCPFQWRHWNEHPAVSGKSVEKTDNPEGSLRFFHQYAMEEASDPVETMELRATVGI
ncbi:hypothetical protein A2716_01825 [candidate division WWE3 bacterium RIFCSPHIGHO2_01_FULL_40_23]|uniref:Uncharacterized protein n=1 Tax=candidate division WWE3 bacterium RIFCSPLOWO2_01_FULL_41_18 TaxID=1802625 RepID=A0A1F4VFM5_UNCKA|nr:MAG: hypothetical protein A2716_01825 [candidate division WWE3 bacterium RIFCSPHIGHO2_01_FULL_40_23]OGC55728.1 MAG: hypothetical protein A3A78_01675 [candidate division WWE3 bacterium RIFCSPLOWO2_01_FULL_41_18]